MTCIDKTKCTSSTVYKIGDINDNDIYRCKSDCDTITTLMIKSDSVVCYDYDTKVTQ